MKFDNINLNRLRTFQVVYQHHGIRPAAKLVHVTPAAISTSIKMLEEELGFMLFTRVGHDMVPTTSAVSLHRVVSRMLVELDNTLVQLEGDTLQMRGALRIGAPNGFGVQVLVPLVRAFQLEYPNIDLTLRFGTPDRLVPLLLDDLVDMTVVPRLRGNTDRRLKATRLPFSYAPRLVCARKVWEGQLHRRRRYKTVSALDHVSLWEGREGLVAWYWRHFGVRPNLRIALEVDNIFAAVAAVRDGSCIALLPSDVIATYLDSGAFVDLCPKNTEQESPYQLLQLKNRALRHSERTFAQYLAHSVVRS